jgi:hypothetical protein
MAVATGKEARCTKCGEWLPVVVSPTEPTGAAQIGGLSSIPDFARALRAATERQGSISVPLADGRVLLGVDEAAQLR